MDLIQIEKIQLSTLPAKTCSQGREQGLTRSILVLTGLFWGLFLAQFQPLPDTRPHLKDAPRSSLLRPQEAPSYCCPE
jgi:hypothetical protein